MKKLYFIMFLCALTVLLTNGATANISDDFEDGVIDTSLWVTHGHKGGVGGVGAGDWQYSVSEHISTDGYLQARVWGPTSGNSYGAEAWVRTTKNFNDGQSWLINFTWETTVGYTAHCDVFVVHITDGTDPVDVYFDWIVQERPSEPIYDSRLEASNRLWRYALHWGGPSWVADTPSPPFDKRTWSITTDPSGSATIYQSPDGQGVPYRTVSLDPSEPWYVGFYLNDMTSAGFTEGDNTFKLYDFSARPQPQVQATVDIDPDTLNLKSKGRWITCYIELPEGYDVGDIDVDSISLETVLGVEHSDVQDGVLMVKFDRDDLIFYLEFILGIQTPDDVTLMVIGELKDGTPFEGSDTIKVINPGKLK